MERPEHVSIQAGRAGEDLNPGVVSNPRRLEEVASVAAAKREMSKKHLSCCFNTVVQGSKSLVSLLEATDENI